MNQEETKNLMLEIKTMFETQLKIMQHFADGGEIEVSPKWHSIWEPVAAPRWDWSNYDYRIKKYLPEIGKWYVVPVWHKADCWNKGEGSINMKCIAYEFGFYYFSKLEDDEPRIIVYQDNYDFTGFNEAM